MVSIRLPGAVDFVLNEFIIFWACLLPVMRFSSKWQHCHTNFNVINIVHQEANLRCSLRHPPLCDDCPIRWDVFRGQTVHLFFSGADDRDGNENYSREDGHTTAEEERSLVTSCDVIHPTWWTKNIKMTLWWRHMSIKASTVNGNWIVCSTASSG